MNVTFRRGSCTTTSPSDAVCASDYAALLQNLASYASKGGRARDLRWNLLARGGSRRVPKITSLLEIVMLV